MKMEIKELAGRYNLDGFYIFNGVQGIQTGKVHCFENGVVIGTVVDDNKVDKEIINYEKGKALVNSPGKTKNRLLLGFISSELDFQFLKLNPVGYQRGEDTLWATKGILNKGKLNFYGGWDLIGERGMQIACSSIPGLESILQKEIKDADSVIHALNNLPYNIFWEKLFTSSNHKFVFKDPAYNTQRTGELSLERI